MSLNVSLLVSDHKQEPLGNCHIEGLASHQWPQGQFHYFNLQSIHTVYSTTWKTNDKIGKIDETPEFSFLRTTVVCTASLQPT